MMDPTLSPTPSLAAFLVEGRPRNDEFRSVAPTELCPPFSAESLCNMSVTILDTEAWASVDTTESKVRRP